MATIYQDAPTEQIQKRMQDLTTQDTAQRQFFEDKFKEYKEFLEASLTIQVIR